MSTYILTFEEATAIRKAAARYVHAALDGKAEAGANEFSRVVEKMELLGAPETTPRAFSFAPSLTRASSAELRRRADLLDTLADLRESGDDGNEIARVIREFIEGGAK